MTVPLAAVTAGMGRGIIDVERVIDMRLQPLSRGVIGVLVCAGLLAGCGGPASRGSRIAPVPEPSVAPPAAVSTPQALPPATEPTSSAVEQKLVLTRVYFVRGEKLTPVGRGVPAGSPARGAVEELLRGPTSDEAESGCGSTIPSGTHLNGVTISQGTATVDLSKEFESGGGSLSMTLRIAQVVATLTQFSTVKRVAFKLDGRPVRAIGGEGVIVDPPRSRTSIEGELPAILVETPLPHDEVGRPLRFQGSANVFEARFRVRVIDASGKTIAEQAVMATSGTGTRGTFDATIAYPGKHEGPGRIEAFEVSPKDGSRIRIVSIPVTLR